MVDWGDAEGWVEGLGFQVLGFRVWESSGGLGRCGTVGEMK